MKGQNTPMAEGFEMDLKLLLESFLNVMDIGAVFESINNYRKRSWKVDIREIIKYLIKGRGYKNLTPPQTSRLLSDNEESVHIIDLRETATYDKNNINGSISKPIDDFFKEVFEGTLFCKQADQRIVLVCDTGQLSKVAAAVLAEEGFTKVYSIKGGMRRWNRWMKLTRNMFFRNMPSCCTQMP